LVKDIVAHLTGWNRNLAARIQAAHRGEPQPPPPWPAHLEAEDDINACETQHHQGRAYHVVQLGDQRFLAGEFFDHFHDDHEADVRAWLAQTGKELR
jgi:hypothetical protein